MKVDACLMSLKGYDTGVYWLNIYFHLKVTNIEVQYSGLIQCKMSYTLLMSSAAFSQFGCVSGHLI